MTKNKNNYFSDRMAGKKTEELEYMLKYPEDYQKEAIQAAIWELERRSEVATDEQKNSDNTDSKEITGEWQYTQFIKGIKKKHSFKFTPTYEESFRSSLQYEQISIISKKVFEKLEWYIVHFEPNQLEAKRMPESESRHEKITVKIEQSGTVHVKSKSLGSESWDNGRNSIRVKLFIHVFNELAENLTEKDINKLSEATRRELNMEDYVIPETLPSAPEFKQPNFLIFLLFSLTGAVFIGFIFAYMSSFVHIIILYESLAGFLLGYIVFRGVKASNFLEGVKTQIVLIISVMSIVILNQYFQFILIKGEINELDFSFFEFIQIRLKQGFIVKGFNTGWIGWIIVWLLQGGLIFLISWFKLSITVTKFLIERVPNEVLEFALYHMIKGKNRDEIISELSKKGWKNALAQESVLDALGAAYSAQEFNRGS